MSSIVTITFSPCIDKSASVPALIPEKKLQCSTVKLEPGGGGINVARAIKKLGGNATAIFPSGGYTGKYLNHLVQEEDIPSIIIQTTKETRENIIILDEKSNNQYRFGMPANELSEDEWKKCLQALDELDNPDFIVVSGSLPPGVPMRMFEELSGIAKNKQSKLVVDTSGKALKEALKQGVYLVKPNIGELASLAGVEKIEMDKVEETAMSVIQQYHCDVIVVSLGKDGAMLVTAKESYKVASPKVKTRSTVGAGDSMVAGIIYSLVNGNNLQEALRFGVACGTATTMNPGTELFDKDDVETLYSQLSKP